MSEIDENLEQIKTELGLDFVPLMFTSLRHRPQVLLSTWQLVRHTLLGGEMLRITKEMIFIVTANEKHCPYCAIAHKAMGKQLGLTNELLESIDSDLRYIAPEPLKYQLLFAQSLASNNIGQADSLAAQAIELGIPKSHIEETVLSVSVASLLTTLANGMNLNNQIDGEFQKILAQTR